MPTIGSVVSGHCEIEALPVLLRRILEENLQRFDIRVSVPHRKSEGSLMHQRSDVLARAVERVAAGNDAVLVLLDNEDGCPKTDGPRLQDRAAQATGLPVAVVMAWRELETWFLHDAHALFDVVPDFAPEARRDAKGWIRRNRPLGYDPVEDAPGLCARLDWRRVRETSDSFRVFVDRVERLVAAIDARP